MIAYFKTEVPFLRLVLFFIAGIALSITLNLTPNPIYNYLLLACLGLLLLSNFGYKYLKLYLYRHYVGIIIYITILFMGLVFCNQYKEIYHSKHFSKHQSDALIAVISNEPKIKGDVARFTVNIKQNISHHKAEHTKGNLLVALRIDTTQTFNLNYGDLILLKSKYQETEQAYNPAEFNYKRYLSFQNIYHQTFINQKQVKKIKENEGNAIINFALKFRERQVKKFNNYLANDNAKSVASTLILGYRAQLDKELLNTYSNTGTMHVLSVSGMHVAIVVMLLSFLLRFMNKRNSTKYLRVAIIIALVWFYALITGLAPSVCRAALMVTFVLIAQAKSSPVNIFNVLAISAFILLLHNPFNLVNVGFQLSYIAVAGLIYLYPKIYDLYPAKNKVIKFVWSTTAVSVAAQIATAPISLFYFHQFPVYFVISNLFIVIPAILIMYLGIAFLLAGIFTPAIKFLGYLLNEVLVFTNNGLHQIEQIPHANITQIWLSGWEILLLYALIISVLAIRKNNKLLRVSFIVLSFMVISLSIKQYKHIQQKNVTFFSLRKNTAVVFIEGRNAVLLTDLKNDEFTYQFSVKPYLDSCNIKNIQYINPHQQKSERIYTFHDKKLKIINHQSKGFSASNVNWLLLSSDKKALLNNVVSSNKFEEILIDGKNRDFIINDFKLQAKALNIKPRVLKREFAVEYKL